MRRKSTQTSQTTQKPKEKDESAMRILQRKERLAKSYAAVKKKWVDLTPISHLLKDVIHDKRCREVTQEGRKIILNSLADCALLEGDERRDIGLLKLGIVVGHFLILQRTKIGIVCIDGNHKLAVYRDTL